MIDAQTIISNVQHIREIMEQAAQRAGRKADDVQLMAVTKTQPYAAVEAAFEAGLTLFGENKVQEALDKYPATEDRSYTLHMIGHLQRNKVKKAIDFFDMIESVDSEHIAQDINKRAAASDVLKPVLLEINIGEESNKTGCMPHEAERIADRVATLDSLSVCGIMAIPPYCENPEHARCYFVHIKELFESLKPIFGDRFKILSMGMSNDYEIAVEEGSTLVRIGTAIFGPRLRR